MRKAVWLLVAVQLAIAAGLITCVAQEEFRGPVLARAPMMLDGDTAVLIGDGRPGLLSQEKSIIGFAFGPGRNEVAFCAQTSEGRSGLYVVTAVLAEPTMPPASVQGPGGRRGGGGGPGMGGRGGGMGAGLPAEPRSVYRVPRSGPRLLWTAPEGVTLRGPVWWSPNGGQIAVREMAAGRADLVGVDYVSGTAVQLTEHAKVTDAAWGPDGTRLAYVAGTEGASSVFVQALPPAEPRRLGAGGLDLRWSVDGKTLRWIVPAKDTWAQWAWDGAQAQVVAQLPPRAEGASWSPDGRLCAALEGDPKQLVLYPTASTAGETVELNGVQPQRLLGWSPDSRVVLLLAQGNRPVAVSARKTTEIRDDIVRYLASAKLEYKHLRASSAGPPIDPEVGLPSWSSKGDLLAYVWASEEPFWLLTWQQGRAPQIDSASAEEEWEREGILPWANRALLALDVHRQFVSARDTQVQEDQPLTPLEVRLLTNVKNIAMALQMYLTDYDAFPDVRTVEEARAVLNEYIRNQDVWLMPDGQEVVVRYLAPPGLKVSEIDDPAYYPTVVVEILPDWDMVGYADGHAKKCRKGEWGAPPQ